jgi:hypothetical protein
MSFVTATELWRLSATELAEAIRTRQASSVEVVEAHLWRIEAVNPSINAVVIVLGEQALEAAKAADRVVAAALTSCRSAASLSRSRTISTSSARRPPRDSRRSPMRIRPGTLQASSG